LHSSRTSGSLCVAQRYRAQRQSFEGRDEQRGKAGTGWFNIARHLVVAVPVLVIVPFILVPALIWIGHV
jgi:hypothetical protein